MKVITNFDFYNAVKDVNESLLPVKVIRNNQKRYIQLFPVYLSATLIIKQFTDMDAKAIIPTIINAYGYLLSFDTILQIITKLLNQSHRDFYTENGINNLKKLIVLLERINVYTNYEMLLKSELYARKYCFDTENRTIPAVVSKKYLYVPSYGYDGNEKTTSILQEHTIGTKEYILSQDEPDKEYRRVLSKSHI